MPKEEQYEFYLRVYDGKAHKGLLDLESSRR